MTTSCHRRTCQPDGRTTRTQERTGCGEAEARRETRDTVTLDLTPAEPFSFLPGQFNMLSVPGIGEAPISVSGDPADTTHVLHTIRDVGAVTNALCGAQPGEEIGVRGLPMTCCSPASSRTGGTPSAWKPR